MNRPKRKRTIPGGVPMPKHDAPGARPLGQRQATREPWRERSPADLVPEATANQHHRQCVAQCSAATPKSQVRTVAIQM